MGEGEEKKDKFQEKIGKNSPDEWKEDGGNGDERGKKLHYTYTLHTRNERIESSVLCFLSCVCLSIQLLLRGGPGILFV